MDTLSDLYREVAGCFVPMYSVVCTRSRRNTHPFKQTYGCVSALCGVDGKVAGYVVWIRPDLCPGSARFLNVTGSGRCDSA